MNITIAGPDGRPNPRQSAVIGRYAKSVIYRSDCLIADFPNHAKWQACRTALDQPVDLPVSSSSPTHTFRVTLHETPDETRYDSLFDRRIDKPTV